MDKSLLKRIIVSYGVLALHSLQKSANKDYKLKDFKIEHLADEIEVMIGVYPKEIAIVKYFNMMVKKILGHYVSKIQQDQYSEEEEP